MIYFMLGFIVWILAFGLLVYLGFLLLYIYASGKYGNKEGYLNSYIVYLENRYTFHIVVLSAIGASLSLYHIIRLI